MSLISILGLLMAYYTGKIAERLKKSTVTGNVENEIYISPGLNYYAYQDNLRDQIRGDLRQRKYIIINEMWKFYYNDATRRSEILEKQAREVGFSISPF